MDFDYPGRLLIEKVVLKNFKSYAGEKTIGPFHKNLTSVVGPNGSGKSNLLESLLFAFGKRARKMRLKKLSELIHHSNSYPNLTEASVEVHFLNILDKDENFSIVPDSNLILTRTVRRNSTSEYRLNSKLSSYEEVTNALKSRGIDLEHNRFLILQGEVEQIAMMKPKADNREDSKSGLLDYLEEIIGTDKYIPELESVEKDLEKIGDEVSSKIVRFEEAKKTLELLQQPVKEAINYIELEKEFYCFKSLRTRVEIFIRTKKNEEIQGELSIQKEKIKELDQKFELKKKDNEQSINEFQSKLAEIKGNQLKQVGLENEIKKILEIDAEKKEKLEQVLNSIKNGEKEVEINANRCKEIEKDMEEINIWLPNKVNEMSKGKEARESIEERFSKVKAEVDQVTEELQNKKSCLENDLNPHKRELALCKSEKNAKTKDLTSLIQDLANGDLEKGKIESSIETLSINNKKLDTEIQNLTESIEKVKQQSLEVEKITANLQGNITEHKSKAGQIQSKINQIENEEKRLFEARGQLSEILRAKISKTLSGVIGRLGDLGFIGPTFDIAISSVCPRLDNIVVESVKDGEKVIEFCKAKRLGKVNIIILDKINVSLQQMNQFRSPDSKAVRLFDQISISEERLRNVFFFALGNTLFTDFIDDARKIAFGAQRHKVVTKDGNIFDPSGEMRGFANPIKGKMKLTSVHKVVQNTESLKDLREELNEIDKQMEVMIKEKLGLDQQVNNLKTQERESRQMLRVKQNEIILFSDELESMKNRMKVIGTRSLVDLNNERINLETIISKISEKYEKTLKLIDNKKTAINELEQKIEEVAGKEFIELKNNLVKLIADEEKCELEISKAKQKLQQRVKDLEKYSKTKEKLKSELEVLNDDKLKLKEKRVKIEERVKKLADEFQAGKAKLEEGQKCLKELEIKKQQISKEFQELLEVREQIKSIKNDLNSQLKVLEAEISKLETKLQHNIAEFQALDKDYGNLMQNMEEESTQVQSLDHRAKKSKFFEERISLKKPVQWEASQEELLSLLPKLKTLEEIEENLGQELSISKPNLRIIEDYKQKKAEKDHREESLMSVKQQEIELRGKYIEIKSKRFNEFTKGFREISGKLRVLYTLLTRGGNAELEFADSTDPFSEGIVFTVRPPSKSWKKMSNLSGGEKTLSSLALVFALHHYKPNALYIMDEVDAALDFQNVSIIANYIKGETKNAQFIVVSLRYQMFEVADQLVGIYKVKDVTHSLSVSPASLRTSKSDNAIIVQTLKNITAKCK